MFEVIDHTPLIHPVRNASELVEYSTGQDFIKIRVSEWRPRWLKDLLLGIKSGEYGGVALSEIPLAAFHTNSLLKRAAAYHELNGHIKTLMENAISRLDCISYYSNLMYLEHTRAKPSLIYLLKPMSGALVQSLTQELIANTMEIDVLRHHMRHKTLGAQVQKRTRYLDNLGKEEDWFCDMCAGPLCTHRAAMYLRGLIQEKTTLSIKDIASFTYGFGCLSHKGLIKGQNLSIARKSAREAAIYPDFTLMELARGIKQFEKVDGKRVRELMRRQLARTQRDGGTKIVFEADYMGAGVVLGETTIPLPRSIFSIDSQQSFFKKMFIKGDWMSINTHKKEEVWKAVSEKPLRDLIAKSFLVATDRDMSLFVAKEVIPKDQKMRAYHLDALINLKFLAIQTYGCVGHLVRRDHSTCPSRSGSRCLFKERLRRPPIKQTSGVDQVFDCLFGDKRVLSMFETVKTSLGRLREARSEQSACTFGVRHYF